MIDPITVAFGLAQYAPSIIKWLTGSDKAEEVAEKVIDVAKQVTGRNDGEMALEELRVNPDLVLAFRQKIAEQEADLDKAYLADRQSARDRDREYVRARVHNWRSDVLALLAVAGLVICVWFVARDTDMPERAVNAIMFVAGVLASAVRDVYAFEFGSSRGSKEKDDIISRALKNDR